MRPLPPVSRCVPSRLSQCIPPPPPMPSPARPTRTLHLCWLQVGGEVPIAGFRGLRGFGPPDTGSGVQAPQRRAFLRMKGSWWSFLTRQLMPIHRPHSTMASSHSEWCWWLAGWWRPATAWRRRRSECSITCASSVAYTCVRTRLLGNARAELYRPLS
jgi:hypothetical protein